MENTIEIIRRLNILKRATELDIFTMQRDIDITNSLERLSDMAVRYIKKVTPHFQFPIKPEVGPLYSEVLYRDRNNWCHYEVIENKKIHNGMVIIIVDSEAQVIDLIVSM